MAKYRSANTMYRSFLIEEIDNLSNRELQKFGAYVFELATGCHCNISNVVLLEGGGGTLWFRVGLFYFYIDESHGCNNYYISNEHKDIVQRIL